MIKSVTSILEKVRDDNNLIVTIPKVCEEDISILCRLLLLYSMVKSNLYYEVKIPEYF